MVFNNFFITYFSLKKGLSDKPMLYDTIGRKLISIKDKYPEALAFVISF